MKCEKKGCAKNATMDLHDASYNVHSYCRRHFWEALDSLLGGTEKETGPRRFLIVRRTHWAKARSYLLDDGRWGTCGLNARKQPFILSSAKEAEALVKALHDADKTREHSIEITRRAWWI